MEWAQRDRLSGWVRLEVMASRWCRLNDDARAEVIDVDQPLPVNIYREFQKVMVAAPLPGMEPQNIRVQVDGRRISIQGTLRGPGQNRKRYVLRQWAAGPYHCAVDLPAPVDAARANATFDNGVLVVILPLSAQPISGRISMPKIGTSKGRLIRHVGLMPSPARERKG